mmetsp:Transcript_4219/g.4944  ORF Transcript_4219/g.4944 Transcript_4219/m.4944 type:complete len:85 (+) Transcript_4219:72-326(+)
MNCKFLSLAKWHCGCGVPWAGAAGSRGGCQEEVGTEYCGCGVTQTCLGGGIGTDATLGLYGWGREGKKKKHGTTFHPPPLPSFS